MNSSYRTNKFSLWERCCECHIENAILECNKCGDALCRNTACCEIFPHYFNTEFIICRECCNAVEKKIKAVVRALMLPIYLTPYISAHVEDPKTFANPFDTPINPRKTYA